MNLTDLSEKQLHKLQRDIDKELGSREKKKKAEARKAAEAAAKKLGFSLSDLVGDTPKPKGKPGPKPGTKRGKAAPKYANPEDKAQKWSGRGRQPAWFKDALAKGISPDDMAV